MQDSKLQQILLRHEGLRLKPYKDIEGKLTIGVGRNLGDIGISKDEALYLLRNDMEEKRKECEEAFSWFTSLDQVRQDVLIDMAFMGIGRLKSFVKMLNYISKGQFNLAAKEMLNSTWAQEVGNRAKEDAQMMESGEYL